MTGRVFNNRYQITERIGIGGRALQNQLVGHLQRGKPLKQPAAPVTPRTVDVQQSAAPERGEHAVEPTGPAGVRDMLKYSRRSISLELSVSRLPHSPISRGSMPSCRQ